MQLKNHLIKRRKNDMLIKLFSDKAKGLGATDAELAETYACASQLTANNVFY